MSRQIRYKRRRSNVADFESADGSNADSYSEALAKLIPSEVLSVYITVIGIIESSRDRSLNAMWVMFVFSMLVTPIVLRYSMKVRDGIQLSISTVAFVLWAWAFGGPFESLSYPSYLPSSLVVIFTFTMPLISTIRECDEF